jgi:unsaturated rhamnogalacturonyl hydrolase
MKKLLLCLSLLSFSVQAQTSSSTRLPWSQRLAETVMKNNPDSILYPTARAAHWEYEMGVFMRAIEQLWYRTGNGRYFDYIQKNVGNFVRDDGTIRTYVLDEYNIDLITPGRSLLMLAQQTLPGNSREKYRKAADVLRNQLTQQPRTTEGGFWHKKRYPNQMWLDGLYMAEPFYAEYSFLFDPKDTQTKSFDDITNQFVWMETHARDPKTGLLYHGWDESKQQKWANAQTGNSPNFWSRSIGWYAMALVDVLDYLPASYPRRGELVTILQRLMPAVVKFQDPASGCWFQVTDRLGDKGNYLEASGTAMFVYALAKGVRKGYLPASMMTSARKGYAGMLKNFISTDINGLIHLEKTVLVGGLGGNPYRDGSYDYYLSEPLRQDDLKGVGPFIFASIEMEIDQDRVVPMGSQKTVGVDTYFNHESRKGSTGQPEPFHYTWEDRQHSGFWLWGDTFRDLGATTVSVPAPTASSLQNVSVYIIVDPDTKKETASPNYVSPTDIQAISKWVKAGGVLMLMANDTSNCEHPHFNQLASEFGIQFLPKNVNMVQGNQFEQGAVQIETTQRTALSKTIFPTTRQVYIKELSPLGLQSPAQAVVSKNGDVIMAVAKWGKGTVFAVGDPWLYNEYTDGRKIPAQYENFNAGKELATWLLKQASATSSPVSSRK